MKNKVLFVCDGSIRSYDDQFATKENIKFLNFSIVEGETLKTFVDDRKNLTLDEIVDFQDKGVKLTTSLPNEIDIKNIVSNGLKEYEYIVFFSIPSRFSGTYNLINKIISDQDTLDKNRIMLLAAKNFVHNSISDFVELHEHSKKLEVNNFLVNLKDFYEQLPFNKRLIIIFGTLKYAENSGRLNLSFFKKIAKALRIKMAIQFSKNLSPLPFATSKSTNKIIFKFLKSIEEIEKGTLYLYDTGIGKMEKANIEKVISQFNPVIKFEWVYSPNVYVVLFGRFFSMCFINKKELDVK